MRIAILVIAATATSLGNYLTLATALTGVAFCYWRYPAANWRQAARLVKRMRWFFLSIVVVYFWFTPGQVLFSVDDIASRWLPTYEGVELGLHRALILVLIIFMVNLLLQTTPPDRLLTAIYWWTRPLRVVGVDARKLALRINLVLAYVPQSHALIDEAKAQVTSVPHDNKAVWFIQLRRLGQVIGQAMIHAERRAASEVLLEFELPEAQQPACRQWLLPAGLIALAVALQNVTTLFAV